MKRYEKIARAFVWACWAIGVVAVVLIFYQYQVWKHDTGAGEQLYGAIHGIFVPAPEISAADTALYEGKISKTMRKFGGRIRLAAARHDRDWRDVLAIVIVESEGNPRAISKSNAIGLMQLKRPTALQMGVSDPYHPYDNLWAGTRYLNHLRDAYGYKTFPEQLAAYNRGPNGIRKWLEENSPYDHSYVQKVLKVRALVFNVYPLDLMKGQDIASTR